MSDYNATDDALETLTRIVCKWADTAGGNGEEFSVTMRCRPCRKEHDHKVPYPNDADMLVEAVQVLLRAGRVRRVGRSRNRFVWSGK